MRSFRKPLGGSSSIGFFSFQDIIMATTGILIVISLILALQIDVLRSPATRALSTDREASDASPERLDEITRQLAAARAELVELRAAARDSESEAEVRAEIERLESAVARLAARRETLEDRAPTAPRADRETRQRVAEILRLRHELTGAREKLETLKAENPGMQRDLVALEREVKAAESAVLQKRKENEDVVRLIPDAADTTKEPVIVDLRGDRVVVMRFDEPTPKAIARLPEFYEWIERFEKADQYFVVYVRPSGASRFEDLRNGIRRKGFEIGYDAIAEEVTLSLEKKEGS